MNISGCLTEESNSQIIQEFALPLTQVMGILITVTGITPPCYIFPINHHKQLPFKEKPSASPAEGFFRMVRFYGFQWFHVPGQIPGRSGWFHFPGHYSATASRFHNREAGSGKEEPGPVPVPPLHGTGIRRPLRCEAAGSWCKAGRWTTGSGGAVILVEPFQDRFPEFLAVFDFHQILLGSWGMEMAVSRARGWLRLTQ